MSTPKLLLISSARADWQLNPVHTFVARYDFNRDKLKRQNAGGFNLPARATDSGALSHSLRFSETAIINQRVFNETRLGLTFQRATEQALTNSPAITVLGAFSDGGAGLQSLAQEEWRIELTDDLSIVSGNHSLKLGAQITGRRIRDSRAENFNGTFVFGGVIAPQLDEQGKIVMGPNGPALVDISGLEQYRRTLLGLPGGAPTRFSINSPFFGRANSALLSRRIELGVRFDF